MINKLRVHKELVVWLLVFTLFLLFGQKLIIYSHEFGHALYAMVKGIPFSELVWDIGIPRPSVTVPDYFPIEYLPAFRYAGGVFAGIVTSIIYGAIGYLGFKLYIKRKKGFSLSAILVVLPFSFVFGFVVKEFANSYFESTQFESYRLGYMHSVIQNIFNWATITHFLVVAIAYIIKRPPKI